MQVVANYWWLIVLPLAGWLWWKSIRRTPRGYWIWLLRIAGIMLIAVAVTWLITGDVENKYVSLHLGGGWRDFGVCLVLGAVALLGAQRLALRPEQFR
jgi:uncharacterized membrane protein YraQ (UPF0718 family)